MLEKLSITKGLGSISNRRELLTEYVDLSGYKDLRLVAFTNSPLDLHIIHSLDGEAMGILQRYKLQPNQWRSERFDVQMKYVAIQIVNVSGLTNDNLVVTVNGTSRRGSLFSTPQNSVPPQIPPQIPPQNSVPSILKKSSKSPFKRIGFKKEVVRDPLPKLILEGALMVGNRRDSMDCLPRGNPYEVLMIGKDGFPTWTPIKEMIDAYLDQKNSITVEGDFVESTIM
jgi:hypothetical protein